MHGNTFLLKLKYKIEQRHYLPFVELGIGTKTSFYQYPIGNVKKVSDSTFALSD
jgi:hypothetical protein